MVSRILCKLSSQWRAIWEPGHISLRQATVCFACMLSYQSTCMLVCPSICVMQGSQGLDRACLCASHAITEWFLEDTGSQAACFMMLIMSFCSPGTSVRSMQQHNQPLLIYKHVILKPVKCAAWHSVYMKMSRQRDQWQVSWEALMHDYAHMQCTYGNGAHALAAASLSQMRHML